MSILYRKIQIHGKKGEYQVAWRPFPVDYLVPRVYKRRRGFLSSVFKWKRVWDGPNLSRAKVLKMPKDCVISWFETTVKEYERYIESWEE